MRRMIVWGGLAVLMVLLGSRTLFAGGAGGDDWVGRTLEGFRVITASGETRSFEEISKGRTAIVFSFFGLRCSACIDEIPSLNRFHAAFSPKGVGVYGVNVDGVDGNIVIEFLKKNNIRMEYPILVDPEFALVEKFGMNSAPLTMVLDATSTVRYRHEGYKQGDEKELERILTDMVESSPPK